MAELPHPWNIYARLQATLLSGREISSQSWGTEAAMNRLLVSLQDSKPLTCDDIVRAEASERRRERHRATLRLVHLAGHDVSAHPEDALAARHELHVVRSKVSEQDWSVLCQVAVGYDYAEVACNNGGTPGSLRVRVLRLRRQLAVKAA